ncbi:allose kinase [Paenibacillus algorifonticola]|uniref:Allose kinase n=1 Tax=Paenibacillus algorifonticola TaxID=684063 RepID=A0A1I2F604_9BACL|nr:allose kinase [Paenibacillus algorifonticola]SFF00267.1 allose kinase [Paenibacillus algorifonticola]
MKEFVLGVDIGGTHIRLGKVTRDGQLHEFHIQKTQLLRDSDEPLQLLITMLGDYLAACKGELIAVSLGFPSIISKDKKVVLSTPNMPGFDHLNVVEALEAVFKVPVFIDNDVNNLLLQEIVDRRLPDTGVIVGFYIGTGFGNSIYMNGQFLRGKNGVAAELGHIPVLGRDELCGCGNPGCVELYASGMRLQQIKQEHFADCEIQDLFSQHQQTEVLQQYLDALSIPIATVINLLDPDYIIMGGGVIHMEGFPREALETYIYRHARKPYPANNLNLSYVEASQTSGVIGAAYHALKSLNKPVMALGE